MKKLISAVEKLAKEISNDPDGSYARLQKLDVLVNSASSPFSKPFRETVDMLAGRDPDNLWFDEAEKNVVESMLEAELVLFSVYAEADSDELAHFELDSEGKDQILKKCDQMRKIVWSSVSFDKAHRVRLLNRISAIETEVHKDRGLFDVVLGGVSDFGETMGKFGGDIKPLTDRMKDIASLTRKQTPEYDQLPSPDEVKKLPSPEE